MKKLPIGKQEFKSLIEDNCIYVDKTEYLLKLIDSAAPIFLSRPRRFGKSLTVTTFKELFKGGKELFKNTFAYDNWNFEQSNPVIHLDLSQVSCNDTESIEKQLYELIREQAENFDFTLIEKSAPNIAFRQLIRKLGKEKPVVLLIDEYDAPILDNLTNPNLIEIKTVLREFYKIIKASEQYIRFVFITGISKFTHVGVFSALNNLEDITLTGDYASIVGYTEKEIDSFFAEEIELVKKHLCLTDKDFREKLAAYYNGYSWDGESFVYNPLSILKFFRNKGRFIPYWMETGSPEYIIRYSEDKKFDITDFEQLKVSDSFLSKRDIDNASPESFLTQAGYLTIKKSDEESFTLDFPNQEVRRSFCELILNAQYSVADADLLDVKAELRKALDAQSVDAIIRQFKIIYSSIPYVHFDANKTEHFYSAVLLMYLQAAGFHASPERLGNKGRLDLSLHDKESVYIFELKVNSAAKAIEQIIEKNYAGAYANKTVILVGLQIDFSERNIVQHKTNRFEDID
ncbi:MAG: AAA family ATPase [Candidatus Electrothrix sp. AR4]|nr:AAA family ATPase [Candidatus Electrothrix sp. AR4]